MARKPVDKAEIRKVMRRVLDDHRDPNTGGVNCTQLAEDAARQLDLYEGQDAAIPEEVFDLAFEVGDEVSTEAAIKRLQGREARLRSNRQVFRIYRVTANTITLRAHVEGPEVTVTHSDFGVRYELLGTDRLFDETRPDFPPDFAPEDAVE